MSNSNESGGYEKYGKKEKRREINPRSWITSIISPNPASQRANTGFFNNKKAISGWVFLIIFGILILYITSTKQVLINGNQISSAGNEVCKLLGSDYNPNTKICQSVIIPNNATKT